jgi:DMSO/TMAO reductase YedYZ heme-binding membrane subunit
MITGPVGEDIRSTVSKLLPVSLFIIPILGTFGYLLFDRKPHLQPLFIASFCSIAFFIITAAGGNMMPSTPARYRTELGISASFLLGFLLISAIEFLKFRVIKVKIKGKFGNFLANSVNPLIGVALLTIVAFTRDLSLYGDSNVLGMWTDVQKGDVWQARDNFMGIDAYLGYAITAIGIMVLTHLAIRSKNIFIKNNNNLSHND